MQIEAKCSGCIHLDGLEWECRLGNKIMAIKVFIPAGPCEKEEFSSLNSAEIEEEGK